MPSGLRSIPTTTLPEAPHTPSMAHSILDYDQALPSSFPRDVLSKPPRTLVDDKVNSIRSIAWNPFGNLIATGAADKTLRVCK